MCCFTALESISYQMHLQVIEFMADHNRKKESDFTYHHCAVLQNHANPDKPIDTRFPPEKK